MNRNEGSCTLTKRRPISCRVTSLPLQEPEEELNKLLLMKRYQNVKG